MDHKLFLALVLVLVALPNVKTTGHCQPLTYFYYMFDWVLEDHIVHTNKVFNEEWCQAYCIRDKLCRSFNYQIKMDATDTGHQCDINYSTKNRHSGSMKKRPGWVHYEIKDADSLPVLEPVSLTTSLTRLWVEEHQDIAIVCNASGKPTPTITWSKASGELSSNSKSNGGQLTLSRVTPYEDDKYICEAKNELSASQVEVKVTVVPLLKFTIIPPPHVTGLHGSRIQINCQGNKHSSVTWQCEGGDLPTGHLIYSNGTLVLLNVSDSFSGGYVCTVKNAFRSMRTTTHVQVIFRSCSLLKAAFPSKPSGSYGIDPDGGDGEDPFTVYCNMTDKNGIGVTVISHNRERREHVVGCDSPGCFKREVTYLGVTTAQLAGLSKVNLRCEQFIMFECNNDVAFIEERFAWWVSREGKPMHYWGGAAPGSNKCGCGMRNTCVGRGGCNCNNYRPGWRNDSGLLTDAFSLPVTQLRFGDVRHAFEEGYYTLGKFKCYGDVANIEPPNISYVQPLVAVVEQGNVILPCEANGRPLPLITWRRTDGQEIMGNWSLSGGNLTFIGVTADDQGTYICEARTRANTATAETTLIVIMFTVMPAALMTASEKAWVQLDCQLNVSSNITWRRKGGELPENCLSYSNGTLVLRDVLALQSGYYECTANFVNNTLRTQTHLLIGNLSCSHIKEAYSEARSGNYTVDPDGDGGEYPFVVYCDMEDKNAAGVTVISHNREQRGHVTGCRFAGCFSRNVVYNGTTLDQLASLTRVTSHCEQFIMFACNNDVMFIEEKYAWWVSREGKPMYYWGGAAPGSRMCACGMSNTCVGGEMCNCKNKSPRGWRNDRGMLTDKFSLPVTQLRFGDVDQAYEEGFYTLGKLRCYGTVPGTISANVARGKLTVQSTVVYSGVSSRAVDGNTNGVYERGTCTQTVRGTGRERRETNPWWRVDLASCYSVTRIAVYNRVDCCSDRLTDMEIRIGTSLSNRGNSNPVVLSGLSLANKKIGNYSFSPRVGRYINIRLVGQNNVLTLCEVEVFGVYSGQNHAPCSTQNFALKAK